MIARAPESSSGGIELRPTSKPLSDTEIAERLKDLQFGRAFTFKSEEEAKGKTLGTGSWSLFPIKCGGVVLFLK